MKWLTGSKFCIKKKSKGSNKICHNWTINLELQGKWIRTLNLTAVANFYLVTNVMHLPYGKIYGTFLLL